MEAHLQAALPLLDVAAASRRHQVVLSVSALANRVCSASGTDCSRIAVVTMLVGRLMGTLTDACQTRSREERQDASYFSDFLLKFY